MQTNPDSLTKIGEVTNKFGISHRSLHYWESAGILKSSRGENDYRFYDGENMQKIKQIVFLRKLRLSIPSIQEVFTSAELSKVIAVFTDHLDETKKETEQLNALGIVLRQLLNMLKDRRDMNSVYKYLDTAHSAESDDLKAALKTVLSEPVKEIAIVAPPEEPIIDMAGIDLSLEEMTEQDILEVTEVVKRCYTNTEDVDKVLEYFNFARDFQMPGCRWWYKIMQNGACIGAVNLASVGMEAMLIRYLAYGDPDNNVYLFELLKQKHLDILCWNIYFPNEGEEADFLYDWEGKKRQFADDNGFTFYTDARWDRYIKMLKPHDEVYNSSRYRFALLDGSMDGVSFRFFGVDRLDWYDGRMTNWRITDCFFGDALIYDTGMPRSQFYKNTMTDCDFRYNNFENSAFNGGNLKNCKIENCDISGLTIDGVNVEEALEAYKSKKKGGVAK